MNSSRGHRRHPALASPARPVLPLLLALGACLATAGPAAGQGAPAAPPRPALLVASPAAAAELLGEGDRLFRERKPAEAAEAYERLLSLDPGNVEARYKLGVALAVQRRLGEAIASWEEVLAREPGHALAEDALLFARWKQAQEQQAAAQAGAKEPQLEQARRLVAAGSYALARQLLAERPLQGTAALEARELEGEALLGEGKPAAAAQAFAAAVGGGPQGAAALLGLGDAWRALGQQERAAWSYRLALASAAGSATLSLEQQRRARQLLDRMALAAKAAPGK